MIRFTRVSAKFVLTVMLVVSFTSGSAFAYTDYEQYATKVMPAARGIQAAQVTWQETQVNYNTMWLRNLLDSFKNIYDTEMATRSSGGGTSDNSADTFSIPSVPMSDGSGTTSGTSGSTTQTTTAAAAIPSTTINDAALNNFVKGKLVGDNLLTRRDMIDIFRYVELDNWVTAAEYEGLRTINYHRYLYPTPDYVWSLAWKVINPSLGNATYNGVALGNLTPNVPGTFLESLVQKWFLGTDHPTTLSTYGVTYGYKLATGKLFVNGASYADIRQGMIGDCWFLAALAEVALRSVSTIYNMFIDNGDNTWTVKYYYDYFTVDRYLPADTAGKFAFANYLSSVSDPNQELWVALAEKALITAMNSWYAGVPFSYKATEGNWIGFGMMIITRLEQHLWNGWNNGTGMTLTDFNSFVSLWNTGAMIAFAANGTVPDSRIAVHHAYSVLRYDAIRKTITLFNPWGVNNPWKPGILTLSWTQMVANFWYFDYVKK